MRTSVPLAVILSCAWSCAGPRGASRHPLGASEQLTVAGLSVEVPTDFVRRTEPELEPAEVDSEVYPRIEGVLFASRRDGSAMLTVDVFPDARFHLPRLATQLTPPDTDVRQKRQMVWAIESSGRTVHVFLPADPDVWHLRFVTDDGQAEPWARSVVPHIHARPFTDDDARRKAHTIARELAAERRRSSPRPPPPRQPKTAPNCVSQCVTTMSSGPGDLNPTRTCEKRCAEGWPWGAD